MRIATKVAPPTADGVDGTRFDRAYIERKLETSLDRLGLERVTFYLAHAPDKTTPIEETVEGFAAVIDAGRVAHVGCCSVGSEELLKDNRMIGYKLTINAARHPDVVAVVYGARQLTYAALNERACRLANGLAALRQTPQH